jgi:hypothetical protein
MQVVCGNCQLNFQAPDGASGLVCPICRSPLRPAQASTDGAANKNILEWDGGSLNDLMAILTAPALAVRVEVVPAGSDAPVGEVHLLAGGVSEALYGGVSTEDALDKLRAVSPARYRIEPRLPNPADGDLTYPGPDSGSLETRPLAHLMRYCEEYVITCAIEVWRGNENARVEYRKGEISVVTVGGIDAPERLAEVMQWSSGNYRLVVPRLTLPEVAAKAPAKAPEAAPAAAAPQTPRPTPSAATRTIFGMPALDAAAIQAAQATAASAPAAAKPTQKEVAPPLAAVAPASPAPSAAVAASSSQAAMPASSPSISAPPGAAQAPVPAPIPPRDRQAGTKTIFGVPAPAVPAAPPPAARRPTPAVPTATVTAPPPEAAKPSPPPAAPARAPEQGGQGGKKGQRGDKRRGQRPPEVVHRPSQPALATSSTQPPSAAAAAAATPTADVGRSTHHGYGSAAPEVVLTRPAAGAEDRTQPTRIAARNRQLETPIWAYVGVGFTFGLALLAIYQLVGALAH